MFVIKTNCIFYYNVHNIVNYNYSKFYIPIDPCTPGRTYIPMYIKFSSSGSHIQAFIFIFYKISMKFVGSGLKFI